MDYVQNVRKYRRNVDKDAVKALKDRYRLVLTQPDNRTVAFSDITEVERVKTNFLKKQLGLTDEAAMNEALDAVNTLLSDDHEKNRLTVYYLLADHFGKLDLVKHLDD